MAYTDAGNTASNLEYVPTPKLLSYYHFGCVVNPLSKELIQSLIDNEVFDPQNGLRGIYQAQLDDDGDHRAERPIVRMFVFTLEDVPFGVVLARRVTSIPKVDYILHLYVKPEWRRKGYGRRMLHQMWYLGALPGMAMEETESSKHLLTSFPTVSPLRRPSALDRDYARCLRTLERKEKWTNEEGSLLCHETILDTLKAQHALIEQLRKQVNPHDNSITYPC